MNYRELSDNELAGFMRNLRDLLSGGSLSAIDPTVRSALLAEIGSIPDDLTTQATDAMVAEDVRKAAVSTRNATKQRARELAGRVRHALLSGDAPQSHYDLCAFDHTEVRSATYNALDPGDLFAVGFSNGVNKLRFAGNNRRGMVTYEIWRREGTGGTWVFHTSTTKQSFVDTPVTPGQFYEYKVRAMAAKSTSNYSNTAVVYGVM